MIRTTAEFISKHIAMLVQAGIDKALHISIPFQVSRPYVQLRGAEAVKQIGGEIYLRARREEGSFDVCVDVNGVEFFALCTQDEVIQAGLEMASITSPESAEEDEFPF